MYGIETIKESLIWGFKFAKAFEEKNEDGKVTWLEWVSLFPKLLGLKDIILSREKLLKEWFDMDNAEKTILGDFIRDNFDLNDDDVEEFIEATIDYVCATSVYIGKMQAFIRNRKLKKAAIEKDDSVGGGGPGGDPEPGGEG